MKAFILALALTLTSTAAVAHDHAVSSIEGEGIHLFERNHAFAGQILETPVFGAFEHDPFGGKIQFRKGEKTLTLELVDVQGEYQGSVTEVGADGIASLSTSVRLVDIEKTGPVTGRITLEIDGKTVFVDVRGKTFGQGHFQEPHFEATLGDKAVAFDFTGESCFGYSSNLGMMIYGVYAHLQKDAK